MPDPQTTPKPIQMSAWSARRILDRAKTETRRTVGDYVEHYDAVSVPSQQGLRDGKEVDFYHYPDGSGMLVEPDYRPGDRLYVREPVYRGEDGRAHHEADDELVIEVGDNPRWLDPVNIGSNPYWPDHWSRDRQPSMFMPKAWSRVLLEVTEVGVERLQEIGDRSIRNEGIEVNGTTKISPLLLRERFIDRWNDLHGDGAWDEDPWVWVIKFDVLHPDQPHERE